MFVKRNCIFFEEIQDMSARVPICLRYNEYGDCPCDTCNSSIDKATAFKIILEYEKQKKDENK